MLRISWRTEVVGEGAGGNLELSSAEHVLEFDAATRISHSGSAVLTEHAVEGESISEHKRTEKARLTITATVTNTPLGTPPPSGYGQAGESPEGTVRPNDSKVAVLQFAQVFDRVSDVFDTVIRLNNSPILLVVETDIRTYEDYTLIGYTAPEQVGDAIAFEIEIEAVRLARTATVESPAPREPRGRADADQGDQGADDATAGEGAQSQSILDQVAEDPAGFLEGLF